MGASLGTSGSMSEINMTPLIDIVLVVLIIMMVNIPIQVEKMGVKLPSEVTQQDPPDEPVDQLVIMIYEDGSVALNKELMPEDLVFGEIGRRLRPLEKKRVFIDAHPEVTYETVIDMVDVAKEAGAQKVAFARLKDEGPAAPTKMRRGAMDKGVYPGSPLVALLEPATFDEADADAALQPFLPTIRACYDRALAETPKLNGKYVLQVDVGPDGEILGTEVVSSTLESETLDTCIAEQVPAMSFPPIGPQNTARVRYPLFFSPG